jgi:hypothetical protein
MRRMRRALLGGRRSRRILGPILGPGLQRLRLAHARREAGDHRTAADEFHALAERGEAGGIPRSVQAFVLAGQSYLLAGQHDEGVADLQRSVQAAVRFGQLPRLAAASTRIAAELRADGFGQEADAFLDMLASAGQQPLASQPSAGPAQATPRLPPKCPSCGGTIHPGEVEWVDPHSIACEYCGSVVQAEKG